GLTHAPTFRALYNAWKADAQESMRARLMAMADSATATLSNAVNRGDVRAAMFLVRTLSGGAAAARVTGRPVPPDPNIRAAEGLTDSDDPDVLRRALDLTRRGHN